MEINSLRRELRALPAVSTDQLSSYTGRFDDILRRYNVNHDEVDYEKYKLEHPHEYPQEDPTTVETARKDVRKEKILLERLPYAFGFATAALVVGATAGSFAGVIEAVLQWITDISSSR